MCLISLLHLSVQTKPLTLFTEIELFIELIYIFLLFFLLVLVWISRIKCMCVCVLHHVLSYSMLRIKA